MAEQSKHDEITRKIIGCAIKVHSVLGNGLQEVIYQRAIDIEMSYNNISFEHEKETPVYYREINIGTRRVDFLLRA